MSQDEIFSEILNEIPDDVLDLTGGPVVYQYFEAEAAYCCSSLWSNDDLEEGGEAKSETPSRNTGLQAARDKIWGMLRCRLPYLRTLLEVVDHLPSPNNLHSSLSHSRTGPVGATNKLSQPQMEELESVLTEFCSVVTLAEPSKKHERCSFLCAIADTTVQDAKNLREELVNEMLSMGPATFNFSGEDWKAYTQGMRKSTTPCDINMALAAAEFFCREIVIVQGNGLPIKVSPPKACEDEFKKRFPVIVGCLTIDGLHQYFGTRPNGKKSGFLSGNRFNMYAAAFKGQLKVEPKLPKAGENITMATSEKLESEHGYGNSIQLRINKEYVRNHFGGILNKGQMQDQGAFKAARKSLREVINYSMLASGHHRFKTKRGSFSREDVIKHKANLLWLGIRWETYKNWAMQVSNFPERLLYSLTGRNEDECKIDEENYKIQGLKALKQGIEAFFTSSVCDPPSLAATTAANTKIFMHECLAFIKDKYRDFKVRNETKGEETYEKELNKNDPLESLLVLDEKETRSKLFVLTFCLIQRGNISRVFGDMEGAKKYLDQAEELLKRHKEPSAEHAGLPPHLEALWYEISRNGVDIELSEPSCRNLSIRLGIVKAQMIRQVASNDKNDGGWNTQELIELLHRIKVETHDHQEYEISNRFVRFQELMCRLYVAHGMCNYRASSSEANSKRISPDDLREAAMLDLRDLEKEYDETIQLARKENDEVKEYFSVLHQQFVKAELLKFELKKIKIISAEVARDKWQDMLNVRKEILGIGQRHTINSQYKYGKLCEELGENLDEAMEEIESALEHQKDDGWKVDCLLPTYAKLCLKKKQPDKAIAKVKEALKCEREKQEKELNANKKNEVKLKQLLDDLEDLHKTKKLNRKRKHEHSHGRRNTKQRQ